MNFADKLLGDLWSSRTRFVSFPNGSFTDSADRARRAARRTFYRVEHEHIEQQKTETEG
jgi:hypothetical protein